MYLHTRAEKNILLGAESEKNKVLHTVRKVNNLSS